MTANEYLEKHKELDERTGWRKIIPRFVCMDGFYMSVQASIGHYCRPRVDDSDYYSHVEVGYSSSAEASLMEYCENPDNPTDTVYAYVPVEVVDAIIIKHGGIKEEQNDTKT